MSRVTTSCTGFAAAVIMMSLGLAGSGRAEAIDSAAASVPVTSTETSTAYSDFMRKVQEGLVREVIIDDHFVQGQLSDGTRFRTTTPDDPNMVSSLLARGVKVTAARTGAGWPWIGALVAVSAILFLVGVSVGSGRTSQPRSGGGSPAPMGFGRSKARLSPPNSEKVTFEDVAGVEEAEQDLRELVDFLRAPEKFRRLGAKIPRGCLLMGPPGTGKTLLARAIAGEAGVPFLSLSGSEFVEMFVGVGAGRVRDLFAQARACAPCIVFIDEIDAVGRHRAAGLGGGNDERDQTLNQLLVEMDGFAPNEGVVLVAATNRPDVLDAALLRPGRFDRRIAVDPPDIIGREHILKVHLRATPLAADVDVKQIARGTPGFSGAELANLVNEAALLGARRGAEHIGAADLEAAKDKILMGSERRSLAMTEAEREVTAFHEAGHALVALCTPGHDPLHKVTIIPRGRALGVTLLLPERDRYGYTRQELEAKIAMMFGGRVAEELVFGKDSVTTGASDDLRQATHLARRMVTEFGFSDRLGPLGYEEQDPSSHLGHVGARRSNIAEATAQIIDKEIRRIVDEGQARARMILTARSGELRRLAAALLEHETLPGSDVRDLIEAAASDVAGDPHNATPCPAVVNGKAIREGRSSLRVAAETSTRGSNNISGD
ncbi:cell division protease FtsH [Phenylobacterium haematophilum]|uniref:ATP-dependent zinc metalloprotease FtsH n=1 Tax=Phenylobacterium haematophilum TaxID=98513 RepID=A0A840A4P1_9CAUL|nr:ATP-dependent zinc metalloprotease FtsH [Phenylobacterium haematophilum]MBB3892959.1 cell division protease FtsH [Phenylobacterium haematophilum]